MLIVVLSITKATALPIYAAGIAAAWLYHLVRTRRVDFRSTALGLIVGITYVANFLVVLGGASHGMAVRPAQTFRTILSLMMVGHPKGVQANTSVLVIVSAALLIGWLLPGSAHC